MSWITQSPWPASLSDQSVRVINIFKYLETHFKDKIYFFYAHSIYRKANWRIFCYFVTWLLELPEQLLVDSSLDWNLAGIYLQAVLRNAWSIVTDPKHPLHSDFELMLSGWRYKMPLASKKVYKRSFVSKAFNILKNPSYTVKYFYRYIGVLFMLRFECGLIPTNIFIMILLPAWFLTWWTKDNFPLVWTIKLFYSVLFFFFVFFRCS